MQEEGRAWAPFHKQRVRSKFHEEPFQVLGEQTRAPEAQRGEGAGGHRMEGAKEFARPKKAKGVLWRMQDPPWLRGRHRASRKSTSTSQEPASSLSSSAFSRLTDLGK